MKDICLKYARRVSAVSIMIALLFGSLICVAGPRGFVGDAAAEAIDVDRVFAVGVVNMDVTTLNPNIYTTAAEVMTIFPCYSTLLQYDVDGEVIGDLASSWTTSPDGLVWEFNLVENALFFDPVEPEGGDHPVTVDDVLFTFSRMIQEPDSVFGRYLYGFVENMWVGSPYHFGIRLNQPYAPFVNALIDIPILPRYIWEGESLTQFDNAPPIGSGPFYYGSGEPLMEGYVLLMKNPKWHMTELHGWTPRVDRWYLVDVVNEDVGYDMVRTGSIDMLLNVPPSIFLVNIPTEEYVVGISQDSGFVYELNLNQMSDELRSELGGAFNAGSNNQLLLNPTVKSAIAMCVDKQGFTDNVLFGLGDVANSLVPMASPWHHEPAELYSFDPDAAREMLNCQGWVYNEDGIFSPDATPLCRMDDQGLLVDQLTFDFCTLDTTTEWQIGALSIMNWTHHAGIELQLELMSISQMNSAWYAADYDVWLWDWVFDPLGDPSTDILSVMTTSAIGTMSDCFWSNPYYDQLYLESLAETDPEARGEILDIMQTMLYADGSCQCIAYRDALHAMYTGSWQSSTDLSSKYMLLPEVSNTWLSMDLYPTDNGAPTFVAVSTDLEGYVGELLTALSIAIDDDTSTVLEYRFFWGDGTSTDWSVSPTASHAYAKDGIYTVDFAVREATSSHGFLDYFVTSAQTHAVIRDLRNLAPTDLTIEWYPLNPDEGCAIEFVGSAIDPDDDPLSFHWDFGDGDQAYGETVTHIYAEDGFYQVVLAVTDNHIGLGPRPVETWCTIYVDDNAPPMLTISEIPEVFARTPTEFTVDASDSDPEDVLSFTWYWGDGTVTSTSTPTATHTYAHKGTYTLTVVVTDNTGIPGHVVEASASVTVLSIGGGQQHGGTKG